MFASSLVAYLHFVGAFGLIAVLFFEWFTFSRTPTLQEARRLALADRWYGIFATALLVAGFSRAYYFEKGMAYYMSNPFFQLKLSLFIVIGLLSIYPTIRFLRWAPDLKAGRLPQLTEGQYTIISRSLSAQMLLLFVLVLAASLMAHGVGAA